MDMNFPHHELADGQPLERLDHNHLMAILAAQRALWLVHDHAHQTPVANVQDGQCMEARLRLFANSCAGERNRYRSMPRGAFHPQAALSRHEVICKQRINLGDSAIGKADALNNTICPDKTGLIAKKEF